MAQRQCPYLYGGLFIDYLEKYHGKDSISGVYRVNSARIIPYRVNSNAREIYGESFSALWLEWQAYAREYYGRQLEDIRQRGLTEYSAISDRGESSLTPRFSADGKSVYYVEMSSRRDPR
jgi:hypothetical protein